MRTVYVDGVPTMKYSFKTSDRRNVSAVGVLFYSPKNKSFLMQSVPDEKSGEIRLTDFGGKVDAKDKTFIDSLRREVAEETNRVFPPEYNFLLNPGHIYIEKGKYLLMLCQAPQELESKDLSQFGTSEDGSSINRTVEWVSVEDFLRATNLHLRLSISPEVKETVRRLFSSHPH
jgi:8-oxo-dGTP pyrophosphatase MutT (NUDIX family)